MKTIAAASCASLFFCSLVFADDFKTINGKEYKDATVSRVESDGIVLRTKSGISKVYFTELPPEVQQRFNYNPQQAAAYSAQQNAASQGTNEQVAKQQAGAQWMAEQNLAAASLQDQLRQLEQQKADLQQAIREIKHQPKHLTAPAYGLVGHAHKTSYPNPAYDQLPYLNSHLEEVERGIHEVKRKLDEQHQ